MGKSGEARGRPRMFEVELAPVHLRMRADVLDRIDAEADAASMNRSDMIRLLLDEALAARSKKTARKK